MNEVVQRMTALHAEACERAAQEWVYEGVKKYEIRLKAFAFDGGQKLRTALLINGFWHETIETWPQPTENGIKIINQVNTVHRER